MTTSVITDLHTSVCFVILCVKNNHRPRKGLQHMGIPPFIIIRVFPQWLFCFSISMFLLPRFLCSTDPKQACLLHFCICTQHIKSSFPLLYQELFIPTRTFSRSHCYWWGERGWSERGREGVK